MAEQILKAEPVFLLHTETTADGGVTGMIKRLSCGESVSFAGLDQAFLMMNEWMDEENPRPADMVLRTFRTGRRTQPAYLHNMKSARIAGSKPAESDMVQLSGFGRRGDARRKEAFLVRIICRQHNSWQGEVCWKAQRLYFRSTLELMSLIHSALAPGAAKVRTAAGTIVKPAVRVV